MRLLRGIGTATVAAGVWIAAAGFAHAQNNQQNQQNNNQQQNGNNGSSPTQNQPNVPYHPPAPPSGGYGDAETGSYSGKGTVGYGGSGSGSSQSGTSGYGLGANGGLARLPGGIAADDPPQNQQQLEQQQARARNAERQRQLVSDTQKLVTLANELQTEVNGSTKDMLSLDVVRKADEIDKLARSVRDRMKNAN